MIVENVFSQNFTELLSVWENSVRATHNFITDEDIEFFKPIIMEHAGKALVKCCCNTLLHN